MGKIFNISGACRPDRHYMVALESRLEAIRAMIEAGKYFSINRARQYGKTTILRALAGFLKKDYEVVSLDFQRISSLSFESEPEFVAAFSEELLYSVKTFPEGIKEGFGAFVDRSARINSLQALFKVLSQWCKQSENPVVLIIDEVDTAANNQVFLDFLAQLRAAYIHSDVTSAFQSVILAGVYDIRSIRKKIRPDEEHMENSPWNIAAKFAIDMSFSAKEISEMLKEYETDYHTGMDIEAISSLIYNYTSGYPYLVSCLCKNIDEEIAGTKGFPDKSSAWTEKGFYEAEKMIVKEDNTLYQSLIRKLKVYPELRIMLYELLFTGKSIPYVATNQYMKDAAMFGFIRNENDMVVIFNRIFESVLYNYFISEEFSRSKMYYTGVQEKNQFIVGGHLDMRRVLEK